MGNRMNDGDAQNVDQRVQEDMLVDNDERSLLNPLSWLSWFKADENSAE